jgi:lipoate-protein ligase A
MIDTWRFIDTGPCSAAYNMALDEAIAIGVRQNTSPTTLRIYGWSAKSLSIGYFQRIREINIDYCVNNHIPIVRRPTGGRAIFHGNEITYSFSARTTSGPFSRGLLDSYKKISIALGLALRKADLFPEFKLMREKKRSPSDSDGQKNPLCFRSISFGEIAINGKKVVGSAQKRWPDGFLQQGSIPFLLDINEITEIFRSNSFQGIKESMIGLEEIAPGIDYKRLKDAISASFEETFDTRFILSSPSKEEIADALELETQKYLSHEWNFRR